MGVQLEKQAAPMDRTRCVRFATMPVGRLVLGIGLVGLPGFGRSLLNQEGGQHDISRHLEELALPVFEYGRDEMAAGQVREEVDIGEFMQAELPSMGSPASKRLADEG